MKCASLRILVAALTVFAAATCVASQLPFPPITPFTGAGPSMIWWLYGMDHGGVAEDVQLVYHDDPDDPQDQVWAACMNGGFYRSTWNNGAWGDWDMYLPAKKGFGVDAIEVGGTEYVLCASQGLGLRYAESSNSGFGPSWNWPNGQQYYPSSWYKVGTNDAAFYWPTSGTPESPEQEFYVILTSGVSGGNPGIYRWDNDPLVLDFIRVDDAPLGLARQYSHFYRDLATPNVVYVLSETGIYKLSGLYSHPKFEKLPVGTKLDDLPIARPLLPAISNKR